MNDHRNALLVWFVLRENAANGVMPFSFWDGHETMLDEQEIKRAIRLLLAIDAISETDDGWEIHDFELISFSANPAKTGGVP